MNSIQWIIQWLAIIKIVYYNLFCLLYPNLPYIIDQDDGETIKMTEHTPIMRYLARKHGLYPQTKQELIVAEQTESFVEDVSS